jgi:hypothetical protein
MGLLVIGCEQEKHSQEVQWSQNHGKLICCNINGLTAAQQLPVTIQEISSSNLTHSVINSGAPNYLPH